ncbi:hypothetical protein CDD83_2255 [Cordyceps sp. RAO-2017]|nr:hypothetical protein CDD83_2255 [Cordyceps sp. RAO-2017]
MLFGSPGAIAGVSQPAVPRPEESLPLSFEEIHAAAGEIIQALGKVYPEGKVVVIGGLAVAKHLPGRRATRDVDICLVSGFRPNSSEMKETLIKKDSRFYIRQTVSYDRNRLIHPNLFFKNADGKSFEIDLPGKYMLKFDPTSAQVLKDIPAGEVPYLSPAELVLTKIDASRTRVDVAKRAVDAGDAKALLEKYPDSKWETEAETQLVDGFIKEVCGGRKRDLCLQRPSGLKPAGEPAPETPPKVGEEFTKDLEEVMLKETDILARQTFEFGIKRFGVGSLFKSPSSPDAVSALFAAQKAGFRGYESLSTSVNPTSTLKRLKSSTKGAILAVGIVFWAYDVHNALTTNMSSIDRAAVVTSILPIVGCSVQDWADRDKGEDNTETTALCIVSDVLLFTPAWPLGAMIKVGQFLGNLLSKNAELWDDLDRDQLRAHFLEGWNTICQDQKATIESEEFKRELEAQLALRQSEIIYKASELRASLRVAAKHLPENDSTAAPIEPEALKKAEDDLMKMTCDQLEATRNQLGDEIIDRFSTSFVHNAAARYKIRFSEYHEHRIGNEALVSGGLERLAELVHDYDILRLSNSTDDVVESIDNVLRPMFWGLPKQECATANFWGPAEIEVSPAKTTTPEGPPAKTTTPEGSPAKTTTPEGPPAKTTTPEGPPAKTTMPEGPPAKTTMPEGPKKDERPALTPNPDCQEPCSAPRAGFKETITFEHIHYEDKGFFGCQTRTEHGMTIVESAPGCCAFKELKREQTKFGNRHCKGIEDPSECAM